MKVQGVRIVIGLFVVTSMSACTPVVEESHPDGIEMNLGPNEALMTQEQLGREWPLTVDQGIVRCEGAGEVYFETGGTAYLVNGTAQGASDGPEIDPIWADDTSVQGFKAKINVGPIIDRGLELCE